jgi:FkbM family methyltransferase
LAGGVDFGFSLGVGGDLQHDGGMMMRRFYGQCGEDRWIVENLRLPERGVFVDVGAADGVSSSNTKQFEECGWAGLCIEPNPVWFERLKRNRLCAIETSAICSDGLRGGEFRTGDGEGFIGGIAVSTGDVIEVRRRTLGEVLADRTFVDQIDLLSIDTEGTELDVCRSFDWNRYRPGIVIIEHQTMDEPSQIPAIRDWFLTSCPDRYREVLLTKFNLIFVRVDLLDRVHPWAKRVAGHRADS